ncbi:MAG: N-acetylglucosamine-6-phosphate deacetylase, partial [Cyanobacteria bacterium]|nr:N-acetylglucosamine-6-phosphate deacetylase [Cyanobacteriota bacterium]
IDQQINGGLGCLFNQSTISEIYRLLEKLPSYGITSILPTVITAPHMDMITAVNTLEEVIHLGKTTQCRVLGIHLEGPFLNPKFRGAHPEADILPKALVELQDLISPNLKIMTLAPEMDPHGDMIRLLIDRGVHVNLGHSGATFLEAKQAFRLGAKGVTHLYNAMTPFHHREPGLIGAALNDDGVSVEVICDGFHVHPEAIRTAVRCKKPENIILVSDAQSLAGLEDGASVIFGNQPVTNLKGRAVNTEGHLAGSTVFLNECVKNLIKWKILPLGHAFQTVTQNPAKFIGMGDHLGRLSPGCVADMVLWHPETLDPMATWIDGELVFSKISHLPTQPHPAIEAY